MLHKLVATQFLLLIYLEFLLSHNSADSPSRLRCYVQTESLKLIEKCDVKYDIEGCLDKAAVKREFVNGDSVDIFDVSRLLYSFILNITIAPRISEPKSLWVLINGEGEAMKEKRCVQICFPRVTRGMSLHLDQLELPYGDYTLTGLGFNSSSFPPTKQKDVSKYCKNGLKSADVEESFHVSFQVLRHKAKIKRDVPECPCNNCITFSHEYFNDSGLLRFYYNLTKNSCKNFSIKLMKHVDPNVDSEEECLKLETSDYNVLQRMTGVGPTRFSGEVPVDFPNTPTGCYLIRTMQGVFHGFFWLQALNITEMDSWNTTIVLTPRSFDSSVEVSWASPEFPFNFTSWQLTLWYVKEVEVQCEGKNSENRVVDTVKPEEPVLNTTSYVFTNRSAGFYCARIFPIDKRCPSDGCMPRSSKTVRLLAPPENEEEESKKSIHWLVYVVIAVGVAVGVAMAIFFFKYYRKSFKPRMEYSTVPMKSYDLDPLSVLVIWSKLYTEVNPEFESVVKAFKDILRSYCNCSVIDYLDYASLNWKDRQHLLSNPTEWLQENLQDKKTKILFIGTQGIKPKESSKDEKTSNGVEGPRGDSLDSLLFSFTLRFLKNSTELSTDYARIFYIRFPGLYTAENEYEDLVPWMRFNIPNHLRSLSLKLRGFSEECCEGYPHPSEAQTSHLQELMDKCKAKL